MGKVIGIAAQESENSETVVYASAKVSFSNGIADDYRASLKNGQEIRVVTIENWNTVCEELNSKLHWTLSQSNIIIEGVDLVDSVGDVLKIGNFYLEITSKNIPNETYDKNFSGLTKALDQNWRAGVIAKVYSEGFVNEGDAVTLMEKA